MDSERGTTLFYNLCPRRTAPHTFDTVSMSEPQSLSSNKVIEINHTDPKSTRTRLIKVFVFQGISKSGLYSDDWLLRKRATVLLFCAGNTLGNGIYVL